MSIPISEFIPPLLPPSVTIKFVSAFVTLLLLCK